MVLRLLILYLLICTSKTFALDFVPCANDFNCGVIAQVKVNETAIPKIMGNLINAGLKSENLMSKIVTDYDIPTIRSTPVKENCPEQLSQSKCDNICKDPAFDQVPKDKRWSLCPLSLPRSLLSLGDGQIGGIPLRQWGEPVPINIDLPNFKINTLETGPVRVTKSSSNNFELCIPIKEFNIESDLDLKKTVDESSFFKLNKLNLSINDDDVISSPPELCFNITTSNGKIDKIVQVQRPPKRESDSAYHNYFLRAFNVEDASNEEIEAVRNYFTELHPELKQIEDNKLLRATLKNIQREENNKVMGRLPQNSLKLSIAFNEDELDEINQLGALNYYSKLEKQVNQFPANYNSSQFKTTKKDYTDDSLITFIQSSDPQNLPVPIIQQMAGEVLSVSDSVNIALGNIENDEQKLELIDESYPHLASKKDSEKLILYSKLEKISNSRINDFERDPQKAQELIDIFYTEDKKKLFLNNYSTFDLSKAQERLDPFLHKQIKDHYNKLKEQMSQVKDTKAKEEFARRISTDPKHSVEILDEILSVTVNDERYKRFQSIDQAKLFIATKDIINDLALRHPYVISQIEKLISEQVGPILVDTANSSMDSIKLNEFMINRAEFDIEEPLITVQDLVDDPKISEQYKAISPRLDDLSEKLHAIDSNESAELFGMNDYKKDFEDLETLMSSFSSESLSNQSLETLKELKDKITKIKDKILELNKKYPDFSSDLIKNFRVGPSFRRRMAAKDTDTLNLLQNTLERSQSLINQIENNRLARSESLNLATSVNIVDNFSDGFDVAVAMPELCEESIGRPGNLNISETPHDLVTHINVESLNAILKKKFENGDFDVCVDFNELRTCSSTKAFSSTASCEFQKAPYIKWEEQKHVIHFPKLVCTKSVLGSSLLGKALLNEDLGVSLDITPSVCQDGKVCLSPDFKAFLRPVNTNGPMGFISSLVKTATIIYPLVGNAAIGNIINNNAEASLQGIPIPGIKVKDIKTSPDTISIFSDLNVEGKIQEYTTDAIDYALEPN